MQAVKEGYGKTITQVAYNSPDYLMLSALERNVYQFSAAKNYHMLQELTLALKDGDRIRSFSEYRREAFKIVDIWNNTHGQAEYVTGVAASQSIANWERFEKNKDSMPILRFVGVHDAKECPICKEFDGLTRHMDDPIWNVANVPLHFRDRCLVEQLPDADAGQTPDNKLPDTSVVPKMFRVNQAKERLVFPEGSAYFKDLPKDIRHHDITIQRIEVRKWAKENLAGKVVKSEIGDIILSKQNLHAAIGKGGHDYEYEKNTAIYKLPELLKTAKHIKPGNSEDVKGRPNIKWDYLQVRIAGEKSYLNIYRDTDTNKQYFHAITDKIQKKKPI
jgi:hypothetical protein